MKYGKKILTIVFTLFVFGAGLVIEAAAQRRVVYVAPTVSRPIVVRQYVYRDPFWRTRYWGYYDPFYSSYLREQERRYYLERDLEGNRRELAQHLRKYRADGVITEKERRELDDDYKDVAKSIQNLRRYRRYNY